MTAPFLLVDILPTFNASMNALATVLLLSGLAAIKRGHVRLHARFMTIAFGVSALFLVGYVTYHVIQTEPRYYTGSYPKIYYVILVSHIMLAVTIPVLASRTLYLGYKDKRQQHRKWARITFPLWMYVSVTGVMVFLMLND